MGGRQLNSINSLILNKFYKTDCYLHDPEQVTQHLLDSISSCKKVGYGYKLYLKLFGETKSDYLSKGLTIMPDM